MGGLGCDNMTVILVCFLHGQSYDELAKKCARPVDRSKPEPKAIIDDEEMDGTA